MISAPFPDPQAIDHCLLADRPGLRKRLAGLRARVQEGKPFDQGLAKLLADLGHSRDLAEQRRGLVQAVDFPEGLPISARRDEIADAIQKNQVIVLCGETGSGKSTQLPKLCLTLGRGIFGRIGHTQPRRIAARSLAGRIAEELETELGAAVGYKVRFKDHVAPQTRIKLLTDGMLLAEIQRDRLLLEYDTLIIDEAHERSLNIDFLLGYLRQLLPRRPDLKLIITSATIDPERFAAHFGRAPIINVSGRTFPVELRYRPPEEPGAGERDEGLQLALVAAVDELARGQWGDILVFLSGEREIRETAETLRKHGHKGVEVLPLYARQSSAEQARIFHPDGARRIVLATNVAETSLTVPGIRNVIDAGFARISRYSHRSKVQRLPVERVSRASADQRKGRCGRVAEGICIRLYAEEDFTARPEFTEPEIQRTNLASVILQMKILGFGEIERFPFVDPPDSRMIKDGYRVLHEIGAVDGEGHVTLLGRRIARLPVDPRIGRMLMESTQNGSLREVTVIAAALSVQDPRERPLDKQQQADEAHALFRDEDSDFMGLLKLWDYLEEKRHHLTNRKFRDLCKSHFLSGNRVTEWRDIHQQLAAELHEMGYRDNDPPAGYAEIHQALLTGLLSHCGFKEAAQDKSYLGARNSRFFAFPGSGLFAKQPKWVMAAELVETTKLYARTLARIEPDWIERAAGHLIQRNYFEPHWQGKRGQVGAFEKVILFGLTLAPKRRVNYGPINPAEAREIFIRFGLAEGDFETKAPFWRHNRELIDTVQALEEKSRRRDIRVDEEQIVAFYRERVPEGIYSTPQFEQWLREISRSQPKLLHMRLEDLMRPEAPPVDAVAFPNRLDFSGLALPLQYRFDPGQESDGITLVIPLAVLNQVSGDRCDWLTPGLLKELITELLRGLPKQLRKAFVPVPDYAERLSKSLEASDRPLLRALGEELKRLSGVQVPEDAWDMSSLPPHLRMNYRVVDDQGKILGAGRNLAELKQRLVGQVGKPFAGAAVALHEQSGLRDWSCGPLPESIAIQRGGVELRGFPVLVDEGDSVALRILDSQMSAERAQRGGLRRLFLIRLGQTARYLRKNLPDLQRMCLQYANPSTVLRTGAAGEGKADLEEDLIALILDLSFTEGRPPIRDAETFNAALEAGRGELMDRAAEVCKLTAGILDRYQRLRQALAGRKEINWMESLTDMRGHLDRLVFRGFLLETSFIHLQDYPRYLRALELRLDKLGHAAARDRQRLAEMKPKEDEWLERRKRAQTAGRDDERLEELRWLFEELRVSLFAQEAGTAFPISLKRIENRWREMGL
ncbi:MAG: ATP-dependent RNA helicase HrpA [Gammaproteobacteria bacterium]|nr:ATP-dependent RNA helicase HrpA [Gammaproteobacteria bacterium]MBU1655516.1 ATP-dependent RNA helicase HrpA [Gammaproteobacteria bacterium]MBU1961264.1 ATP-dependent RNA helicase HrpA [Gammaproteobacteria bacterium]